MPRPGRSPQDRQAGQSGPPEEPSGVSRRGFLGRLLGLGAVGAIDPSSILGLEGAYARTYVATPGMATVDTAYISTILQQTYSHKDYFEPFQRDFTPLLAELETVRDNAMVSGTYRLGDAPRRYTPPGPAHVHDCSRCGRPMERGCHGKLCASERFEPVVPPGEEDLGWCLDCLDAEDDPALSSAEPAEGGPR